MRSHMQGAVMMGIHVAVLGATACLPPPPGVACGDKWCPDRALCVPVGQDVGVQQLACVAHDICGNGIIEGDEECDCGDDGIIAPGASCAGRGNSDTSGLCRKDCKLHCGDGVLDADEVCDPKLEFRQSCADLRYDFGQPECSLSCREFTTSTCGLWNWQPMVSGVSPTISLQSVWGSGINNTFLVGHDGTILYYNGIKWQSMNSKTSDDLMGVWGSGPDDVFVVGLAGTILHYDGNTWQTLDFRVPSTSGSVWGAVVMMSLLPEIMIQCGIMTEPAGKR